MRAWMIDNRVISAPELDSLEKADYEAVEGFRKAAWDAYLSPITDERNQVMDMLDEIAPSSNHVAELRMLRDRLANLPSYTRRDIHSAAHEALRLLRDENHPSKQVLVQWKQDYDAVNVERYGSHLYSGTAMKVDEVKPVYGEKSPTMFGFEVVNAAFDAALARDPRLIAFGEDVGKLGDVNQGFKGMQEKYGEYRVTDTGIREATILGQAIGMAMRGLRPIAEIQYLDYVLYALANHERRSGHAPLAHRWRTKSARHRAHPRSSTRRHLACWLAHVWHFESRARHVCAWFRVT
jgi:hypothetical protein